MEEEYGIKLKLDLSDFNKQVAKAKNSVKKVENQFREIKVTGSDDIKEIKFDTSKLKEAKKNLEEVADVKERIAKGEIKISRATEVPGSLSEAEYEAQKLRFEMMEKQKQIKIDTSGISKFRQKTEEEMNKVSYTLGDKLDGKLDVIKQKLHQIPSEVSNIARDINKSFSNINLKKKLIPDLKQVQAGFKKVKQESDGFGKNVSKIIGKGITSLKRFALSLFGIQSAYRAVSKAVHSYLAYDQELSKSIQNTWIGLGSFFAPILEYLVSAFQKVLAYANALVQALTGINFVARANAKALNQAGKSAGATAKAMKQLGSFDELNNINTDTGGGAGGGADVNQIELPDVDTSKLQPILDIFEKIKYWASELFAPIKLAWDNVGAELIASVTDTFNKIKELGSTIFLSLFEVWTNGTGQQIVENGLSLWTTFFEIIGNVVNAITEAWNKNNNGTEILQTIANIVQDIQKFALSVADTLKKWTASKEFQSALDFIFQLVRDITGWIEKIAKWVLDMWDKYVKPVLDEKVIPLVGVLIELLKTIWDNVLKPLVEKVSNFLKPIIESVIKMVMDRVGNIIDILKSVAQFLIGVFSGDWKKAFEGIKNIVSSVLNTIKDTFTNVFNTIWSVIKGILNLIIGGFEGMVNRAIKGLNKLISPLTKVGNKVLSVVGINSFNFSAIPNVSLPRLKVGTDEVLSEGIAYLHAGEKVVPADVVKGGYSGSDNEETNELLRQLITLIDEKDFEPYIRVDDIGSASVNYINKKKRITGEAIV